MSARYECVRRVGVGVVVTSFLYPSRDVAGKPPKLLNTYVFQKITKWDKTETLAMFKQWYFPSNTIFLKPAQQAMS